MTNPNDPINTICSETLGQTIYDGLSKREYFAGLAMSSMSVDGVMIESGTRVKDPDSIARMSVDYADALIKQLNQP